MPLDDALLGDYPDSGMIHLCGSHGQHIQSFRDMRHLHAVQLNDRAAAYFMQTPILGSEEKVLIAADLSYPVGDELQKAYLVYQKRTPRVIGAVIVMGVMSHVAMQTILNILVVTDTIPNTGIGLPFFSYGGSSLMLLLAEMGMVLSASRASQIRKQ